MSKTLVTATVIDPDGLAYAFGSWSAVLVGVSNPTVNLRNIVGAYAGNLDINGSFTCSLDDNATISPGGSKWRFTIGSGRGTVQESIGTGAQSFTVDITITGASQSISATLSAAAPALSFPVAGGSVAFSAITSGTNTGQALIVGNGSSLAPSGTGTITANVVTGIGSNKQVIFNNAGTLVGDAAFTFDTATKQLDLTNGSTAAPTGLQVVRGNGIGANLILRETIQEDQSSYAHYTSSKAAPAGNFFAQFMANNGAYELNASPDGVKFPGIIFSPTGGIVLITESPDGLRIKINPAAGILAITGSLVTWEGSASGSAAIGVVAAAGSPNRMNLPTTTGNSGDVLSTDGANPQQLSWTAPSTKTIKVLISSAQLLALQGTPLQILPAPAAGKYYVPQFAVAQYDAGGTPYTLGDNTTILWSQGVTITAGPPIIGFLDQASSQVIGTAFSSGPASLATQLAQALMITLDGSANITAGNGTLTITLTYSTVTA